MFVLAGRRANTKREGRYLPAFFCVKSVFLLVALSAAEQHADAGEDGEHGDRLRNALMAMALVIGGSDYCSCENDENDCGDFVH